MNRAFSLSPFTHLVPAGDFFTTLSDEESPQLWPTAGVARLWQVYMGPKPDGLVLVFAFFAKKRANRKEILDLYEALYDRYFSSYDDDPRDAGRYHDAMIRICGRSNVPCSW